MTSGNMCSKCGSPLRLQPDETQPVQCPACGASVVLALSTESSPLFESDAPHIPEMPGFEVLNEVGRGGMGIVYRARQQSLDREVAIKVLPMALSRDPAQLERFRHEAKVAARLIDSHLLPVFDILVDGGNPVLVLPYIRGADLGQVIRDRCAVKQGDIAEQRHPWATLDDKEYLRRVIPVLDQVVDAVAALHQAKVLHRDIKPSNVLVDERGNVWLSDFGLANFWEEATSAGLAGTRGFISPEQFVGDRQIDTRSDVFSLGVTLYEALTLELPYGRNLITPETLLPPPLSDRQPLLTGDDDAVVLKALAPNRERRYQSGTEAQEDWRRLRQGLPPRALELRPIQHVARAMRRYYWRVAVVMGVAILIGLLIWSVIPPLPPYQTVRVVTNPPGARVVLVPIDEQPYDERDGEPMPERAIRPAPGETTPLTLPRVPPGTYLIEAEVPGHGFHEVYRVVPRLEETLSPGTTTGFFQWTVLSDGTIKLMQIDIPRKSIVQRMTRFPGEIFTMGAVRSPDVPPAFQQALSQVAPATSVSVPAFFLDPTEITIGEYRQVQNLPPQLAGSPDSHAVTFVNFDDALSYAESVGKRLPTEVEYEFAATNGGKRQFPWGDDATRIVDWPMGLVSQPNWDYTPTTPPVFGLYSNVAEWTSSWLRPYRSPTSGLTLNSEMEAVWRRGRVVRGGPEAVAKGDVNPTTEWNLGPRWRWALSRDSQYPGLGFRCARSARPRFLDPLSPETP